MFVFDMDVRLLTVKAPEKAELLPLPTGAAFFLGLGGCRKLPPPRGVLRPPNPQMSADVFYLPHKSLFKGTRKSSMLPNYPPVWESVSGQTSEYGEVPMRTSQRLQDQCPRGFWAVTGDA